MQKWRQQQLQHASGRGDDVISEKFGCLGSLLFIWLEIWIKLYNQITPFSRFSRFNFRIYFVRFPHSPPPTHTHLTHCARRSVGKFSLKFRLVRFGLSEVRHCLVGWLVVGSCRFLSADAELIPETDLLLLYVIIIVVVRPRWAGSVFEGDDLIGRDLKLLQSIRERKTSSRQSVICSLWTLFYLFIISFHFVFS